MIFKNFLSCQKNCELFYTKVVHSHDLLNCECDTVSRLQYGAVFSGVPSSWPGRTRPTKIVDESAKLKNRRLQFTK